MSRLSDITRFYELLHDLEDSIGGARTLSDLSEHRDWPDRGVCLFFEPGEIRRDSGKGPRVVRVGTHALTANSRSTLRQRLGQHRGDASGGGNHRGSIFRLLVGQALLASGRLGRCESWGIKGDFAKASAALGSTREAIAEAEEPIENAVSRHLRAMSFMWLAVDDKPGSDSRRGFIERNAIALLSNFERVPIDPPSLGWLGHSSGRPLVRGSGLWNQRHVKATHDPGFLDMLETLAGQMRRI